MFCVLTAVVTDEITDLNVRVHKFTYSELNKVYLKEI